jgi:hypothetical protein
MTSMNTTHAPLLPAPPHRGLSYASVPKILLGLGAFCLVVAGGIFLAVSWSSLGVGGRTAVLATVTLAAFAATLGLHRVGLRMAAEAISVVTLAFLTFDVYGGVASGLLGGLGHAGTTVLAGALLAGAGWGFGQVTRRGLPRLVAPQVVSGVGIALGYLGSANLGEGHPLVVGHLAVVAAGALAWSARRVGLPAQQWSTLAAGGLAWTGATVTAVSDALSSPTLHQLWVVGSGWSLLASSLGLLVPALVLRSRTSLLVGASGSAMLVTVAATLPVIGSSATTVVTVALIVTGAWTAAFATIRGPLRIIAVAPVALGSVILTIAVLVVAGYDLARWVPALPVFSHSFLVHLSGPTSPIAAGLVIPAVLIIIAAAASALTGSTRIGAADLARLAVAGSGVATALTTAAYDVPLAWSVGALALTGTLLAARSLRDDRPVASAYAAVTFALFGAAVIGALPSAALTASAAGAATLVAALLAFQAATPSVGLLGEIALIPFSAIATIALVMQLGHDAWSIPETYTLPLAAELLAIGVFHLRRNASAGTEVLIPGLLLALVPTTLLVLDDPLSLRALLLGAGCLALVLAGAALRWSAPIVAGAAAVTVLVLRELGPYANAVPQWVWIGLAGMVLTAAGITWERQLRDLRRAVSMVGRLR